MAGMMRRNIRRAMLRCMTFWLQSWWLSTWAFWLRELLPLMKDELRTDKMSSVLHFILLVARCCFLPGQFDKDTEIELRDMIREERLQLEALAERRMRLIEENRRLEERLERSLPPLPRDRSLPPLPHEGSEFGDYHDNVEEAPHDGEHQEQLSPRAEDLIDVGRPNDDHGGEHHMTTDDTNNQSR